MKGGALVLLAITLVVNVVGGAIMALASRDPVKK